MKALLLLLVTTFAFSIAACTKKNPMADNLRALNSPVNTPAETPAKTVESEKSSVEMPREGVAPEVLSQDCFQVATDANLSNEESEIICSNANPYSQNCLEKALEVHLLRSSIATVCAAAREGTATCLTDARIKDQKYSEEVADLCK